MKNRLAPNPPPNQVSESYSNSQPLASNPRTNNKNSQLREPKLSSINWSNLIHPCAKHKKSKKHLKSLEEVQNLNPTKSPPVIRLPPL